MKHTKIFFTLLVLAAALLAFGCTSAAVTDATTLTNTRKGWIDSTVAGLVTSFVEKAKTNEIPADDVKKEIKEADKRLKALGVKIKDSNEGQKIDKGANEVTIKARFTTEALPSL